VYSLPSGKEIVVQEGDILWPEREDRPQLNSAKERIGSFAYRAQYLQNPVAREGNLFQAGWLREYHQRPAQFDKVVMALDTAFSTKATADYSAAIVIGLLNQPDGTNEPGYYVLRSWRGRVTFGDLKAQAVSLAGDYNPDEVLVEAKASGQSLIQELQADTTLPVLAIEAEVDKVARANAVSPLFESGRVFLPEDVPWLQGGLKWVAELKEELLSFPSGRHDDMTDALVHGLNHLRHRRDQAIEWARAISQGGPAKPNLAAYDRARLRAIENDRICPVCLKPVRIVQHQRLHEFNGEYHHDQCLGKPHAVRRTDTIDGSNWPGASPFNLIPNHVRLR
jgi:predicted phage terminase large subunit-like protein